MNMEKSCGESVTSVQLGQYIIKTVKSENPPKSMNATKLQKLIYVVHGLLLVVTHAKDSDIRIDESAKAWPYGPVYPKALKYFKKVGLEIDEETDRGYAVIKSIVDEYEIQSLNESILDLASKTAKFLSDWSHQSGSPWAEALEANGGKYNNPITNESMRKYFKQFVIGV